MKKTASVFLALLMVAALASTAVANVTISQVYGGGGSSSTSVTYKNDYVELLNVSASSVDISGWLLAYASSAGSFQTQAVYTIPAGTTIGPCHYFLIQLGTTGTGGGNFPVTPDLAQTAAPYLNLSATAGKIALVQGGTVGTGLCPGTLGNGTGTKVDFVGFASTNCYEGTGPTGVLTNVKAAVRNNGGVTDTDDNAADFTVVTGPVPRNSSTTSPECIQTPTAPTTWGNVKTLYR